jgi:hypothetical protein
MSAAANLPPDLGAVMSEWAKAEPTVSGLVLIGSRVRAAADALELADVHSDWDFHVIASGSRMFLDDAWTRSLQGFPPKAYVARSAVIGGVPKVNLVFADTEADLVIIPAKFLRLLRLLAALGRHRRPGWTQRRMQDIAEVIRPGWRFLVGEEQWGPLYRRAVAEVTDPHLSDKAVRQLADGFVCDYVWTERKLARGEYHTAKRMLYRELAEVNFQLLHELKVRRGERSFTKARRLERVASPAELAGVTVDARLEPAALRAAIEKSAATCRELMAALVGDAWRWPL